MREQKGEGQTVLPVMTGGTGEHAATDKRFLRSLHTDYILRQDDNRAAYLSTEHLRMGGLYWGITALDLLYHNHKNTQLSACSHSNNSDNARKDEEGAGIEVTTIQRSREEVVRWIAKCQKPDGGFGPSLAYDSHITSTHYAVLLLSVYDSLDSINCDAAAAYIKSLQNPKDGSFSGDEWGEVDTRFVYCGLACLKILGRSHLIDIAKAVEFILRCRNFDGGFGSIPGSESHAAYTFCCVAALAVCGRLGEIDKNSLGWWLCERQTPSGGFNGRPEKAPDVCYSWWILSSLQTIGRADWIDAKRLTDFVLDSQDGHGGGIADRPEDEPDVFHTFFGIAALALMKTVSNLREIDPVYAIPARVIQRLNLPPYEDGGSTLGASV